MGCYLDEIYRGKRIFSTESLGGGLREWSAEDCVQIHFGVYGCNDRCLGSAFSRSLCVIETFLGVLSWHPNTSR